MVLKISSSDPEIPQNREIDIMERLALVRSSHNDGNGGSDEKGAENVISMLDHFQHEGPNGTHNCLVLEMLGEDVTNLLERRYDDARLPAKLAKHIARQALLGVAYLHRNDIAHGGKVKFPLIHPSF